MVRWDGKVSLLSRRSSEEHSGCCTGIGLMRGHSTPDTGQDYRGRGLFWLEERVMTRVLDLSELC